LKQRKSVVQKFIITEV